ncbi:MAG: Polyprenyl synthetase [Geminicoccaceae bacterium]|nr:Polyprenyl synthetase [Geminicoccaceae bacterium]
MPDTAPAVVPDLLSEARDRTDGILGRWAERLEREVGGRQGQALAYALRTPGKRVRAALLVAAYRAVGGGAPAIAGIAAAVETVHTYSLVHDDLPCMDNDDLRRGRPTTHRAVDVTTATLAGYLLVPVGRRWRPNCSKPGESRGWWEGSGSTWKLKSASFRCLS